MEHSHKKTPVTLYFIGLALTIAALFVSENNIVLKNILFTLATIAAGYHVIILEGVGETIVHTRLKRRFTPNSHILMGLAAIGASVIGNFWEATLLILIFSGAQFLEHYAEGRSRREITKLLQMSPTTARLIMPNSNTQLVEVKDLKVGDHLQVLNGDQVPIDGVILSGTTSIDESSISGESIPREKYKGDQVFGSTINGSGTFIMEVTKENKDTLFSKILQLVDQNQNNQTKAASIIQKLEPKYVNFVLISIPLIVIGAVIFFNYTWMHSIYRGLVLLVATSPCAIAAATVSVTLSATSNLARHGVLSKGSTYLSQLADIKAIAFDKTGTLTQGKPEVTNDFFSDTIKEEYIIDIIVALEKESNHPLADAILQKFTPNNILDISTTNHIGKGLEGNYDNKNYRIGKPTAFEKVSDEYTNLNYKWSTNGNTVVYVSEDENVIGVIALMDTPREEAKATINYFQKLGIHTTLITGDSEITGQSVARDLGIDEAITNVMPHDKSNIISSQKQKYGITAMVGDGVNDAPALVNADVGIAMGDGTDVAVEVSDLALIHNDISKLVHAHKTSTKMKRVIWQNIFISMGVVAFLVTATFTNLTDITTSVIFHEGSTLVVILNGLRLLR
ncbi:MAG: cadmium-translocating P-type ATPase [Fermentimonas sp.]|nr:cadmium-translocating P-type ATPase [Fermentimonas sp.]